MAAKIQKKNMTMNFAYDERPFLKVIETMPSNNFQRIVSTLFNRNIIKEEISGGLWQFLLSFSQKFGLG